MSSRRLFMPAKVIGGFAFALGLTLVPSGRAVADTELATQRKVHGVITAIDGATMSIATEKQTVTGRLDAARTRVTKNGKPAKATDLVVTAHAKASLCLDDVWLVVDSH